jgi:hypothetical protein
MSDRPTPTPSRRGFRGSEVLLYLTAALSYIALSTKHLWLLDWVIGPAWCVLWVWGIPALARALRGLPVRPVRTPKE